MPPANPHRDRLLRAVSTHGDVAVRALVATALVDDAAGRHRAGPLASAGLGRTLMAAILLAAGGKDGETVQVHFRGHGPLGSLVALADCAGRARGSVENPHLSLPLRGGRPDLPAAIGLGELIVARHRPGWRKPYTGIVPILSGEIATDIALYLEESEQTPAAVGLGVEVNASGRIAGAAGFMALSLPGAEPDVIDRLEENVRGLPPPTELARSGGAAEAIRRLLAGIGGQELESTTPVFHCGCSEERVIRAIALLGREEVDSLCAAGEPVEVRCEFCGDLYRIAPQRVRAQLH